MAGLSSGRREVLERLLGRHDSVPKLTRYERNGPVEASFAQRRMWILDRLLPGSQLYNETTLLTFRHELNPVVIERCLNEIVRRHEVLRTTFRQTTDRLEQVIAPELTIVVPVIDLQAVPSRSASAGIRSGGARRRPAPVRFARGPLVRALLLRGRTEWALALTLHHIVFDAWSMVVMVRELTELEQAFSTGAPSQLPELAIQYADFAEWQRQWLRGQPLDRDDVLADAAGRLAGPAAAREPSTSADPEPRGGATAVPHAVRARRVPARDRDGRRAPRFHDAARGFPGAAAPV